MPRALPPNTDSDTARPKPATQGLFQQDPHLYPQTLAEVLSRAKLTHPGLGLASRGVAAGLPAANPTQKPNSGRPSGSAGVVGQAKHKGVPAQDASNRIGEQPNNPSLARKSAPKVSTGQTLHKGGAVESSQRMTDSGQAGSQAVVLKKEKDEKRKSSVATGSGGIKGHPIQKENKEHQSRHTNVMSSPKQKRPCDSSVIDLTSPSPSPAKFA